VHLVGTLFNIIKVKNLSDMRSEFRTVAMFVIADLQKLRICGVCMIIIYARTKFQMTNSNGSIDTVAKNKAKQCHMSYVGILRTTLTLPGCICFQELLPCITSRLKVNVASVDATSQVRACAMLLLMIVEYYFGMPATGVTFVFSFVTSGES
jgi:hypothetical protein